MTIAGCILVLIILLQFFRKKNNYQFFLFKLTIIISLFINVGYVFTEKTTFSYSTFMMYICVFIAFINKIILRKTFKYSNGKIVISSIILLIVIILGFVNLINSANLAQIVPIDVVIDEVTNGTAYLIVPTFGKVNIGAFRDLLIFCLFCLFSVNYLHDKDKVEDITKTIENGFKIMFIFIIIEFIFSNIVSNTLVRECINIIFGFNDKTYLVPPERYGIYNAYGLFVEPSYVAAIMFGYYIIKYFRGFNGLGDKIYFLLSFIILIISGSSTGIVILPLGMIVLLHWGIKKSKKSMLFIATSILVTPIIIISLIIALNTSKELTGQIFNTTISKVLAYKNEDRSDQGSGYARMNGNKICYDVLKTNPLLGVGLGTTRGFGIIPGALATLGILGVFAYCIFAKYNFNIRITKNNIFMLIVYIAFLCYSLSVWYLYMPAIIGMFIAFNKEQELEIKESY